MPVSTSQTSSRSTNPNPSAGDVLATAAPVVNFITKSQSSLPGVFLGTTIPLLIPACSTCDLHLALTTVSGGSSASRGSTNYVSGQNDQSIVVALTAYSISSEYLSGGTCMTASGTVITLTPPISANAVKPASIAESDFQQILADDFASNLGFLSCLKHEQNYLPTPLAPVSNITATVASGIPISLNSTSLQPFATSTITSSRPSRSSHFGLTVPQQAGTGVGVSLGSILLLLLGWLLLRKRRRQKPISKGVNEPKQPYLQSKAELDDHENRIRVYELEAQRSPIPELEEGDSQDHELEGPVSSPELSDRVPVRRRQELEGQDGSSELNGHEGIIDGVRRASSGG